MPDTVLGQLGNRVQHALRAFTPRDAKAVKAAADTFRQNPAFDAAAAIKELGVGEALVSLLAPDGTPETVERCWIAPPMSRVGPLTPDERRQVIEAGPIYGKYDTPMDRTSAFEMLKARGTAARRGPVPPAVPPVTPSFLPPAPAAAAPTFVPPTSVPPTSVPQSRPRSSAWGDAAVPSAGQGGGPWRPPAPPQAPEPPPEESSGGFLGGIENTIGDWWNGGGTSRGRMTNGQLVVRSAIQSASRSVGTQVARQIMRGVLGGLQR